MVWSLGGRQKCFPIHAPAECREKESMTGIRLVPQDTAIPLSQEASMKALKTIAWRIVVLIIILGEAWEVKAQDAKSPYPSMARLNNT